MKIISKSPAETTKIGSALAKVLNGNEVVALFGDLGTGKTQLTKGIAFELGISADSIVSPTFVIRRDYKGEEKNLVHYDFYLLHEIDRELKEDLKEEILDPTTVVVIEWSERVADTLPQEKIKIDFDYIDENKREISVHFPSSLEGKQGEFSYEVIKCQK